ncbi:hypothetical protein A3F08_01305 [Candidatus Berkelbacteria bacterium RIFCSPHIGHO2_12_FULL_36_9]|uniref:Uncharacterized protein n=1 Tax=Candidatus Berkelbacteria bacterium RIFCSPHIGHO2_12_FULL_36_9 TaxID=1797469 RepID=A0A1F5EFB8_9BACT|nr:MAG: hypothetical protein A3F08_01305 [Candidatus Berkelbacteria bacterium RIFCSPHIGHO2_12_FULL_36_9]
MLMIMRWISENLWIDTKWISENWASAVWCCIAGISITFLVWSIYSPTDNRTSPVSSHNPQTTQQSQTFQTSTQPTVFYCTNFVFDKISWKAVFASIVIVLIWVLYNYWFEITTYSLFAWITWEWSMAWRTVVLIFVIFPILYIKWLMRVFMTERTIFHRIPKFIIGVITALLAWACLYIPDKNFFNISNGQPRKWYSLTSQGYRFFDHKGFDPEYGIELQPVTPDLAELYFTHMANKKKSLMGRIIEKITNSVKNTF